MAGAGCINFLRGVLTGVGSILAQRFRDGCCSDKMPLASWEGSIAPRLLVLPASLWLDDFPFLKSFFCGEVCVEDGGDCGCAPRRELKPFFELEDDAWWKLDNGGGV